MRKIIWLLVCTALFLASAALVAADVPSGWEQVDISSASGGGISDNSAMHAPDPPLIQQLVPTPGVTSTPQAVKNPDEPATGTLSETLSLPGPNAFRPMSLIAATSPSSNSTAPSAALNQTQLLQNPGFDTGQWIPWQVSGASELSTYPYQSAPYSAWLAGYNNADDAVYQNVTVPDDTTELTLDFWYMFESQESQPQGDWFCLDIVDESFSTLIGGPYCNDIYYVPQNEWLTGQAVLSGAQLSPLLGQPVWLLFFAQTDSAAISSVWLDDVKLTAATAQDHRVFLPAVLVGKQPPPA